MDGRRHSVDVPISRAIIALRRVKSLRDPSTNSMSKLSALVDNLNWETNSNNAITLGFENGFCKDNVQEFKNSDFLTDGNGLSRDREIITNGCLVENTELSQEMVFESDYGNKQLNLTYASPYNDFAEGAGSCNELDEMPMQEEKRNIESKKKSMRKKYERFCRVPAGDVLSRSGSPCFSVSDTSKENSNCGISLYGNGDQGCGIRSFWKCRESNLLPDVDEQPLLLTEEKTEWKQNIPFLETPRNLSQKFMPKSFAELVGQNIVVKSLLTTILNDRVNSFYLLHGPRGTGKTSASRIFAAALNCLSRDIEKPCGLCKECVSFFSGNSRDVREVDSIKINRTDKCRSLIKSTEVPPVYSRFKIYIIDECQLLKGEPWRIILSSLKGLPRNVVFIMITLDLDKLPHSVASKSQRYHFQKVEEVEVANRLRKICVEECLDFDQDALNVIAAKSNGSVRDAEMMLDQLSLLQKKITLPLVNEVNGVVSDDELFDLLLLAFSSDASSTVLKARELMRSRIDPLQLISQLANLIMDILAGKCPDGVFEFRRKLFGSDNSDADTQLLSHALKILSETEKQLRTSKNQNTWLIVALLQLSSSGSSLDGTDTRLSVQTLDPQDGDFPIPSMSSTGESLKRAVSCSCENAGKTGTMGSQEALDLVWIRATQMCTSNSLKKFLLKRGNLVSVNLIQGTAVAKLEFDCPHSVSKAEKSWKVIANALQKLLEHNVELRITLACNNASNNCKKLKKPSFNLFGCSRRVQLRSEFPAESFSNTTENSDATPKTVITRDKYVETCSTECGSRTSCTCCHGREFFKTVRNNAGNALKVGDDSTVNRSIPENLARENQPANAYPLNEEINTAHASSFAFTAEKLSGGRRRFLKMHCWRTALLPFRKAWRLTHKQHKERIVDFALHCRHKVA